MKHRAVVVGAGRIGAGYNWDQDLAYTHAGAYQALRDRVELVGFVEHDENRAARAKEKWNVPVYEDVPTGIMALRPDIVSVCVQPSVQQFVMSLIEDVKAIWCEKPFVSKAPEGIPVQVNYMRHGDPLHRQIAAEVPGQKLVVYGKDDIHTRCHFEDLGRWWQAELDYRVFNGPCAYIYGNHFFDKGGVDGGKCFKAMLENLLDHVDTGTPLWSPAHA